eukprot:15475594-Alexandrium_andersonii.AAC.1
MRPRPSLLQPSRGARRGKASTRPSSPTRTLPLRWLAALAPGRGAAPRSAPPGWSCTRWKPPVGSPGSP